MNRTAIHAALLLAFAVPGAAVAQSFDLVDSIPPATGGRFPAYSGAEAPRPTEWYVRGGAMRDTNIFRLSPGAAIVGVTSRADTVARIGAGIRHDQLVAGRQRVRLTANVDHYIFDTYNQLDHTAYGLRGEWLWQFTNDFSGNVGYERRQRMGDLAQLGRPVKDIVTEDNLFGAGAWQVGPSTRLRAGLNTVKGSRTDDTTAETRAAGGRTTSIVGGADYVTTLNNAAGIELRRTTGNFPVQEFVGATTFVDNDFVEKEVAGVLTWIVTPQLRANGRLGRTTRTHQQLGARDFRGTTGRATVDWTPLQKTGFEASIYKEPRSITDIAASYIVVKGVSFGPRWAPTEKLVFTALLTSEKQSFSGDPTPLLVAGTPTREETLRSVRLGARWEPVRFTAISLGIDKGRRTSNVVLRDYDYTALMLNGEIRF